VFALAVRKVLLLGCPSDAWFDLRRVVAADLK